MGWSGKDPIEWANEAMPRLRAVWRGSVEMLAEEMTTTRANGGRLPHVTGNLMRSLLGSTVGPPPLGKPDQFFPGFDVGALVANLELDQTVYLGYQAIYARRVNYGFVGADSLGRSYNQAGAHFLQSAIDAWPTIVELVAEDIMNKVISRG